MSTPKTIKIDNTEYVRLADLSREEIKNEHPYYVGKPYFVRTVTHYFTGELVAVYPQELVFKEVAWIASTGRYADALKSGNFSEVEPYPKDVEVVIGRGALIDAAPINFALPTAQK